VARYFEKAFERGQDLVEAMEAALDESQVFVLFASRESLKSYAVQFEIEEARFRAIMGKIKKVLVFPIEPGIGFADLPQWLQRSWTPNVGESPTDIARYLTTLMLEPDRGLSIAAPKVVGRGSALDRVERLVAAHLQRQRSSPRVYIFPGVSGIGRRTFAAYYLRRGLGTEANLPFGPVLPLSPQAELIDIYRSLRTEIDPFVSLSDLAAEQDSFQTLPIAGQIGEIIRVMSHFTRLGQAITIVSAAGFFEDAATPKSWVGPLVAAIPTEQFLVIVTNLQFRSEYVDELRVAVQMRIEELDDGDLKALMTFTARALGLDNFVISDRLVTAIGGHPDVANAAVKLAAQKGTAILERDPRQLFNIQQAIIGEAVGRDSLTAGEKLVLDVLSWLPNLGSDLLERIVVDELGVQPDAFNNAIEKLVLGCLIYASAYRFSIAPSVRQLYRRENVAEPKTLAAMSKVFADAWATAEADGFRDDLFSAFVFMQVLEGKSLPRELRNLLTPSNLHDAVREAYARGKETDDSVAIQQAIEWGKVAIDMTMSDAVREEILSTVARAQIRIGAWREAEATIGIMRERGYRSVTFLEGHELRKRRRFDEAIPKLRYVVDHFRHNKAAVHELALCYRRQRRWRDLEELLAERGDAVSDSPIFLDFNIGLSIARGELHSVPAAISRLRTMDDNPTRADLRQAQMLQRQGNHRGATEFLTHVIAQGGRSNLRLRSLRAFAAAKAGNLKLAREDLAFIKSLPNSDARAINLEAQILLAEGRPRDALNLIEPLSPQEPGDWAVRANILEAVAGHSDTSLTDATIMRRDAKEIRTRHASELDHFFDE
jgi:tetratricopeptide (TPR) repeat protein